MGLSRKVDDRIDTSGDRCLDGICIADVSVDEAIVRISFDISEVVRIACVRQRVEIRDANAGILAQQQSDEMRADEAAATGHENMGKDERHAG